MASHTTPVSTTRSEDRSECSDPSEAKDTPISSKIHPKASRRRDKPQLSCNQCRRRKSKCDRQCPCSCCSARGQLCTYPESSATPRPSEPSRAAISVHDRIIQLERLVMSMMPDPAPKSDFNATSSVSMPSMTQFDASSIEKSVDAHSERGSMRISDSEHHYVGGDHWVAILDNIADLKDHLDREEQLRLAEGGDCLDGGQENSGATSTTPACFGGAFMLYGCRRAKSRDEILSGLPPKPAVDRYISRYFNYLDLVSSSAVHGPSFLREYDAFWSHPSGAPIIWVGLLFSMICLACLASDQAEGREEEQQSLQVDLYREKIVQCLVMGEYTKCGPYVLETVINYVYVEFIIHPDADKDMCLLLALEVNLARRMGYHRDPSHFDNISPFQGEMRRRLWATVLMSDILLSNQMGMPRMISDSQYDTSEPRNLNDSDFDKEAIELPPSRPDNELTAVLGIIARTRMLKALGIIADLTGAVKPCGYSEVMRVDEILNQAAESIPLPLQVKPMAASLTDTPQVIVARLFIRHMFYKGQVMLHRRFVQMKRSQDEDIYSYSRKTCVDASLRSLEIQHVLDEETCPGGQLHTMRWRVTSIMNHQFLTATMLLCSLLYHDHTGIVEQEAEIRTALQLARSIWMRRSSTSKEAKKAAVTVSIVLTRAGRGNRNNDTATGGQCFRNDSPATHSSDADFDFGGLGLPTDTTYTAIPDFGTLSPLDMQDQVLGFSTLDEWSAFVNWPSLSES
ncbi:hypothetical protein BDV12DRAFT_137809 [Aspergillus spectabilis]